MHLHSVVRIGLQVQQDRFVVAGWMGAILEIHGAVRLHRTAHKKCLFQIWNVCWCKLARMFVLVSINNGIPMVVSFIWYETI